MPTHVAWFERLAYASLALGPIVLALDFDRLSRLAPLPLLAGTIVVTVGLMALVVWLAVRRRRNWARWLFLVLFVLGLPYFFTNLLQQRLLTVPISLLQAVMQGVALYFVFTGDAKPWFAHAPATALPAVPMPRAVERFEQLGYAGLLLGLLASPFELLKVIRGLEGSAVGATGGSIGALVAELLGIALGWLLVWLIARHRQGWARWVFLSLSLLGLAYLIVGFGKVSLWLAALGGVQVVLWLAAVSFALTDDARPWFAAVPGGAPAAGGKPKARMRVAAAQRIVVEPADVTHRGKVDAHIAEAGQLGIPALVAAPPLFEPLWAAGLQVPPPLFLGFLPAMLIAGLPFGVLWMVLNAFVARLGVAIVLGIWAGLLFGAAVAAYYRHLSRRLALPSWENYLPLSPLPPEG